MVEPCLGRCLPPVLLLLTLASSATTLADGTQTGTIFGAVVDTEGTALQGVAVRARGPQVEREVLTDQRGGFRFPSLTTGRYEVRAELLGLYSSIAVVQVFIGNTAELRLELGETEPDLPATVQGEPIHVVAQAPLADKFDPGVGAEISFDFLDQLPVERFYQSVALVLPGISGGEDGNPNTSGSLRSDNLFLIDGVDTTDPTTGLFGLNLNYEAIQGVDVTTAAAPSEYGRASGAVINVVTRSGTNDFAGTARLLATNNDWDGEYRYAEEQVAHLSSEVGAANSGPDEVDQAVALSLGGPINERRLWFFAAHEDSEDTFFAPTRHGALWDRGVDLRSASLKLTLQATSEHTVVLQSATDSAEFTTFTPFDRGPAENRATSIPTPLSFSIVDRLPGDVFALQDQTQEGEFNKLQWDAAVGQNLSISLTAAVQERRLERGSERSRGVTAGAPHVGVSRFRIAGVDEDPILEEVVLYNGITDEGFEERPRNQANLSLHWFLGTGGADHELRFGVDYQATESKRSFNFPGLDTIDRALGIPVEGQLFIDFDARDDCLTRRECVAFDPLTGDFHPDTFLNFWHREPRVTTEDVVAVHVSDTLAFGRFAIAVGARVEALEGDADLTGVLVDEEVVSPRFRLTYDSRGDGKILYSFGLSRLYEPFLQQFLDTWGRFDILSGFSEYVWAGRVPQCAFQDPEDLASPCWIFNGFLEPVPVQAASLNFDVNRTSVDEVVVSFERQLSPVTAIGLHYVAREWNDLWDNVLQADFTGLFPRAFSEISNLDSAEREYRGIQLLLQKRYANHWQWLGSYTWSETEGNIFQNDGLADFADYADLTDLNVINRFGLAPYDREHRLRFYLSFQIPWERSRLSIGSVVRYESGVPYQTEALSEFGRRFITARGSQRLDELFQLDLSAAFDTRLGSEVGFEIRGEIFNVTDETQILGVETVLNGGLLGLPRSINDLQQPRHFRLTLGLHF